jgi:hypothetical protein
MSQGHIQPPHFATGELWLHCGSVAELALCPVSFGLGRPGREWPFSIRSGKEEEALAIWPLQKDQAPVPSRNQGCLQDPQWFLLSSGEEKRHFRAVCHLARGSLMEAYPGQRQGLEQWFALPRQWGSFEAPTSPFHCWVIGNKEKRVLKARNEAEVALEEKESEGGHG